MSKPRGLFLSIEGGDGSGKGTQHAALLERLSKTGSDVLAVDFPQYGQPSAVPVERYLNNEFGDATKLDPRLASIFFAQDRLAASANIKDALASGKHVVANRFSASNMAHQGAKMQSGTERIEFFKWLHKLEHEDMGIPFPDVHIVLGLDAKVAQNRVLKKSARSYTDKKLDGHEASLEFLANSEQAYRDLVATFFDNFVLVECIEPDGKEKSVEEIHEEIWEIVKRAMTDE